MSAKFSVCRTRYYVLVGLHIPVFYDQKIPMSGDPRLSRVPGLGSLCTHAFRTRMSWRIPGPNQLLGFQGPVALEDYLAQ